MRHDKAEARGAEWPATAGRQPQRTHCSTLVRACQRTEIVRDGLKLELHIEFVDSLASLRPSSIIADASMADVEAVPRVGHETTLSELIGLLIGGREPSIRLRPGSIARPNAPELHPGPCAELESLLTPKQLSAIGR